MSWITTLTGKHFNFAQIAQDTICIEDIAGALSNICRFTGHLPEFYSVAQHSVLCSQIVPPAFAFEALMHDAAEAYCSDINSPLKALLPDYQAILSNVEHAIALKFNLPPAMSAPVKRADLIMLATERRDFGLDDGTPWQILDGIDPALFLITPLAPQQARVLFLQRYNELKSVNSVKASEVQRDKYGYWTHPDFFEPAGGNEYGAPGEFDTWLDANNLEYYALSLECDADASDIAEKYADGDLDCDISTWHPSQPDGDGWFIGSIHDTEDGPYCIWLRTKHGGDHAS